ncbi:MAG: hypothetical protein ACK51F_19320 [Rhodospirillales bacterium]
MARDLAPPEATAWRRRAAAFWAAHDANAGPAPLDLEPRREALLADLELAYCAGAWSAVVLVGWALVEEIDRAGAAPGRNAPDLDWLRAQRNAWAHGGSADPASLPAVADGVLRVVFSHLFAAAWR